MNSTAALIISVVIAFGITAGLGFVIIPWLRKLKFGQTILDIGPKWHKSKQGTPNMGGLMFIIGIVISFALTALIYHLSGGNLESEYSSIMNGRELVLLLAGLILALGCGAVGFIDDFTKIKLKRNEGLSPKQKTLGQLIVTLGYIATLWMSHNTSWYIPFIGRVNFEKNIFTAVVFWILSIFIVYGCVNSVNLTDGIDGLCSSVTSTVAIAFIVLGYIQGFAGLTIFSGALLGGVLGFLCWNWNPAKTFMEKECSNIKSALINSNEFVHSTPKDFGENSIICLSCHKGNTPETIAAAKLGKEKGAAVIILTWLEESEIVEFGDYIIQYSFDASPDHLKGDIDYAGEKTMCALLVAVETLQQTAGYENYDKFYEGLGMITGIIRNARKHVQARAEQFAETYKDDTVIYTMGSGAGYGAAYMESICIFMEMQWLDSSSIHTGEYFHGPFEITDANRPFMIQISEGSTRELDERALKFLHTYAKRIEVLDAKELGLSTIDASVVDYFNHSLFNNVYPIYNHELAEKKEHPLSTRRYMWKVEY